MFRKRASRPKKNNISRTHGHRAHPRTKGKARRGGQVGGIGERAGVRLRAKAQGVKGAGGAGGVVRLARALMVLSTLRLAPTHYHHLCPSDHLCPLGLLGPLQALHSARSYFVAPPLVLTPINTSKLADGCKNKKRCLSTSSCFVWSCGEGGIRTPGASQLNGFQDRRNRPLCHLSGHKSTIRNLNHQKKSEIFFEKYLTPLLMC